MARGPISGSNSIRIKAHNQQAILLSLLQHGALSRSGLARRTGLSATTISNQTSTLLAQGYLREEDAPVPAGKRSVGRPQTGLQIAPGAAAVLGIHIGIGTIRAARHDLFGRVQEERVAEFDLQEAATAVLARAADLAAALPAPESIPLLGVGVGIPGLVDPAAGRSLQAIGLGWRDVAVSERIAARLGLPVQVENNVRAMGLGSAMFGAGRGSDLQVFVYGRVGVGAGIVRNGQIFRGSGGGAGEIGHMIVAAEDGPLCRCGRRGCLETQVSAPALLDAAAEIGFQTEVSGRAAIAALLLAAGEGDESLQALLQERARLLGVTLANLVNFLNPKCIVLGGLFAQGEQFFLPMVRQTVRELAFARLGRSVKIETTHFGAQAGVVGAAALALAAEFYGAGIR
jgi:N-acetylglucosamine repressor